jgi:hypothetical protein
MMDERGKPDTLFFYQLLLPIDEPTKSGIKDDPQIPFYTKAAKQSNLYALCDLKLGLDYGHSLGLTYATKLLCWDGVVTMDGVRGGSNGAILRRFKTQMIIRRMTDTSQVPCVQLVGSN